MQYMLLIYTDEAATPAPKPGEAVTISPAYVAYTQALHEAKVWRAGDRLQPISTATTVRMVNGRSEVLNGPYAETREQLGGLAGGRVYDIVHSGRTSTWPRLAAGQRAAHDRAASRSGTSIR